jgi:hypothetical protein
MRLLDVFCVCGARILLRFVLLVVFCVLALPETLDVVCVESEAMISQRCFSHVQCIVTRLAFFSFPSLSLAGYSGRGR